MLLSELLLMWLAVVQRAPALVSLQGEVLLVVTAMLTVAVATNTGIRCMIRNIITINTRSRYSLYDNSYHRW